MIGKTYKNIQLNSGKIASRISEVFREYNELSLLYNSKICHAFKDMQEFLNYYQSSDSVIQSIQNKLDMIIDIQKTRMEKELFGENQIQATKVQSLLKGQLNLSKPVERNFNSLKRSIE